MRNCLFILAAYATPLAAQEMDHSHMDMNMPGMEMPPPPPALKQPVPAPSAPSVPSALPADTPPPAPSAAPAPPMPHDMAGMDQTGFGDITFGDPKMPPFKYGSGTSLLPANIGYMHGIHVISGGWMLMLHGYAWGAYTDQGGPRGDKMAFIESMAMAQADHSLGHGAGLQLRAMTSLEPLMGARGYPNLFASGETANGIPLIDRQHPHDLFMELSARVKVDVGGNKFFLYGGPVAEPALGPSAFMHRASAKLNPAAPITHHWFDSTHISYGVVTAGVSREHWQVEASAFRGREPDERRWNIETDLRSLKRTVQLHHIQAKAAQPAQHVDLDLHAELGLPIVQLR